MSTIAENLTKLVEDRNNIATALTNKGIEVPENSKLSAFPKIIDNIEIKNPTFIDSLDTNKMKPFYWLDDTENYKNGFAKNLPYPIKYGGCAVVYNNEIHVLGGENNVGYERYHYKLNGTSWTSVSTLPYKLTNAGAVVYNGEIHILGGYYSANYHYKFDGNTWTSVSTLPYSAFSYATGRVVVYNNEIHIMSTGNSTHYKFDGNTWTQVSTLPTGSSGIFSVIYNDEIHILGGSSHNLHYKWDNTNWIQLTDNNTSTYVDSSGVLVYNNEIHVIGDRWTSGGSGRHDVWNGTNWISRLDLKKKFCYGNALEYHGGIFLLGSESYTTLFCIGGYY